MRAKATARAKKLKGRSEVFLQSLVNRNIGSRTGKDVKAGKLIDKDEDGFDNFDAYWSESDADVTSNTTFHSKLSSVSGRPENDSQALTAHGHSSSLSSVHTSTSLKVSGTGTYYLGNRTIGSRTGKNIKAGKNIRRCDDGIENFDDYWSESEQNFEIVQCFFTKLDTKIGLVVDWCLLPTTFIDDFVFFLLWKREEKFLNEAESILSFHRSIRANDTRSSLGADMPQERDDNISSMTGEDGSEGEVVINPIHQSPVNRLENAGWGQGKDSDGDEQGDGDGHAVADASELVDDSLDDTANKQRCPDTRSVTGTYTQHQQSFGHNQANDIPEDSTVSSSSDCQVSRSEQFDVETEIEDVECKPESTEDCSHSTVEVPLEQSSQSTFSENNQDNVVSGTVLKRPDSLGRSRLSDIMQLQAQGEEKHVTADAASIQFEMVQKATTDDNKADSSSQLTETENIQVQQSGELSSPGRYASARGRSKLKTTLNRSRQGRKSLGEECNPSICVDVDGCVSTRRTRSKNKQSFEAAGVQPLDASSSKGRKQMKSLSNSGDVTDDTEIQPQEPSFSRDRKKKSFSNSGDVTDDTKIQDLQPSSRKGRKQMKSLSNSGDVTDDTTIQDLEPSSRKGRKQKNSLSNSGDVTDDTTIQDLQPSSRKGRKQKKSLSNFGDVTDDTEIQPQEPSFSKDRKQKKSFSNSGDVTDDTTIQDLQPSSRKGRKQMKSFSNSGDATDDTEIQPQEPSFSKDRKQKKSFSNSGDVTDDTTIQDLQPSSRKGRKQMKSFSNSGDATDDTEIQPQEPSFSKDRKQKKSFSNSGDVTDDTTIQDLQPSSRKGRKQMKSFSNSGDATDDTEIQPQEPSFSKDRKQKKSFSNSGDVTDDTTIQDLQPSSRKGRKQMKSFSNSGDATDDTEIQPQEPSFSKDRKQKKSFSNSGDVTDDTTIQDLQPSSRKGRKQMKSFSNSGDATDDTEIQPQEPSFSKDRKQKKSFSNSGDVTDDTTIQDLQPSSRNGRKQMKSFSNSGDATDDTTIQDLQPSSRKGRKQKKSFSNSGDVTDDTTIQDLEPSSRKVRKQKKKKSLSNSADVTDVTEIQPQESSSSKGRKQRKSLSNSENVIVQQTHSETAVKGLSSGRNNRCKNKILDKSSCTDTGMSNKKENKNAEKIVKSADSSEHEKILTQGKSVLDLADATNADQQESQLDAADSTNLETGAHFHHTESDQEELKAGAHHTDSDQEELEAGAHNIDSDQEELEAGAHHTDSQEELEAGAHHTDSDQEELEAGAHHTDSDQEELEAGAHNTDSDQEELEAGAHHTDSDQEELEAGAHNTDSDQEELEAGENHSNDDQAELDEGSSHTINIVTDDKILEKIEQSRKQSGSKNADHEKNNCPVSKVSSNTGRNKYATRNMQNTLQMLGSFDMDESYATSQSAKQNDDVSGNTETAPNYGKDDAQPSEHFNTQAGHSLGGDITLADFNDQGPGQKSVSVTGLDIGGDVTGSISKNTNATVSIIPSHTPMLSFRTKKRLSYSKLLNDSLEKRSQTETSSSLPAVSGVTQPPSLESVVEEEATSDHDNKDDHNADFLCLRPGRGSSFKLEEGQDSTEEEFWMVDDKPPKKKKNVKKNIGRANSVKQEGNSAPDVMEEYTVTGKKTTQTKTENVKKSAGQDLTSPVISEADIMAEDEEGMLQHTLFTDTPTSCNPRKRKSPQQPSTSSGRKKSKSARVTKTRVIMKGSRKSVPAVNRASLSQLSHLSITIPSETPKSGVSFRQRRRTSVSDVESEKTNKHKRNISSFVKESIVSTSPRVKPLTPCLANSNVKSVQKKKRRVTISNIVEKASVSYSDSTGSEQEPKIGDSPNCSDFKSNLSDITGSPIHIFEMTNTATPQPITAPPKSKIIFPKPAPEGVRRSNRVRLKPIAWFKNERVIYERRKSGSFEIAGVMPSKEAEYLAAEAEKLKKRRARMKMTKETKSSKLSRKKLLSKANLSVHTDLSSALDYTVSSDFPVMNPETHEEVLVDCAAPVDNSLYVGPDGDSPCEGDPYIICHAIQQPAFTVGHLLIAPLGEKPTQALEDNTLIFTIVHGKLSVTIHRGSTVLEAGDQFFVPRGNTYSLKNLRNEEAKLSFVNLNENSSP